jgi:hypothetical protein
MEELLGNVTDLSEVEDRLIENFADVFEMTTSIEEPVSILA